MCQVLAAFLLSSMLEPRVFLAQNQEQRGAQHILNANTLIQNLTAKI
jgi:hypothetical protein